MSTIRAAHVIACGLFLAGCAGPGKTFVTHDNTGLCLNFERPSDSEIKMSLCNCGQGAVRVGVDEMPWNPINDEQMTLIRKEAGRDVAVAKKPYGGFHDVTAFLFYNMPPNECMSGSIKLGERFDIDQDVSSAHWQLVWSGNIMGDGEMWALRATYDF